jgi:hypothetical protein
VAFSQEKIEHAAGEAVVASSMGQSLDSRYSSSGVYGIGRAIASLWSRRRVQVQQRADALDLPNIFNIAVSTGNVHFLRPVKRDLEPVASLARAGLRGEVKRGWFWTRLTLSNEQTPASAVVFFSPLAGKGRKDVVRELTGSAPPD